MCLIHPGHKCIRFVKGTPRSCQAVPHVSLPALVRIAIKDECRAPKSEEMFESRNDIATKDETPTKSVSESRPLGYDTFEYEFGIRTL